MHDDTPRIIDTDALKRRPLPDHPAELYSVAGTATPISLKEAGGDAAVDHYRRHGWLAVRDVWSAATVAETGRLLDDLASARAAGIAERQAEAGDAGAETATATPRIRKLGFSVATAADGGLPVAEPTMLGIVRRLLGATEVDLYQAMALLKPPHGGREKPWHQDHAYFDLALGTPIVGVWIAIDTADVDNGCMQVLDGGHRAGPRPHFAIRDWQLCDAEMLGVKSVAVPLEPGGALFFDGLLPHGTPTNRSTRRRRAVQLHYFPAGACRISKADRFAAFGDRGTATC